MEILNYLSSQFRRNQNESLESSTLYSNVCTISKYRYSGRVVYEGNLDPYVHLNNGSKGRMLGEVRMNTRWILLNALRLVLAVTCYTFAFRFMGLPLKTELTVAAFFLVGSFIQRLEVSKE